MNFNYTLLSELPCMAWCAEIQQDQQTINIYHGEDVYTQDNSFIEGVWNGDFEEQDFMNASFLLGSGGTITADQELVFSTPSHTLERLHSITADRTLYISNSLALVLVFSENQLNPNYLNYEKDLCSIVHGLSKYQRYIPLKNKQHVQIHYYTNLLVKGITITEQAKIRKKDFLDFDDYMTRLRKSLAAIQYNGSSPRRGKQYSFVTTISQGYDASAASAIMREFDCDTALTFNAPGKYAVDSGEALANLLSYSNIITRDARQFLDNLNLVEAEFVASGELGTNVIFSAFETEFRDSIVVTGEAGDFFWSLNEVPSDEFVFEEENYPQISMIETRLRIGFISLPLPYFGASQWKSITAISHSKEMKAYSVGGEYDRPIPRRILEEAGIPRGSFAKQNIGAGINYRYDNLSYLKQRMSQHSYQHFLSYYRKHKRNRFVNLAYWLEFLWVNRAIYSNFILRRLNFPTLFEEKASLLPNPGPPSYLVQWGIYILRQRYIPIVAKVKKQKNTYFRNGGRSIEIQL